MSPEIGNHIYGAIAIANSAAAPLLWYILLNQGVSYKNYYFWGLAVAMLSVAIAWMPVTLAYPFHFIQGKGAAGFWLGTCLASIDGPMIGYIIAIVIILFGYFEPIDSGLTFRADIHFWLGIIMAICIDVLFITI